MTYSASYGLLAVGLLALMVSCIRNDVQAMKQCQAYGASETTCFHALNR